MEKRNETDFLGSKEIPSNALYGIHTARAMENFQLAQRRVNPELIKAYGWVKLACTQINRELGYFNDNKKADTIEQACREMTEGLLTDSILVECLTRRSRNLNQHER